MSYRDVYVGDAADPGFTWEPDDNQWQGNSPQRISEFFPESSSRPYYELKKRIASGEMDGKQVDWGAWAAKVTKGQIQDFLKDCYPTEQHQEVLKLVEKMDVDKLYLLVASEL